MKVEIVTNKQLEILILLYRYRFLHSIHIQKFLHHKDRSLIKRWLKDLTQRHIIHKIHPTNRENINRPPVYYLANKARPILKTRYKEADQSMLDRVYREKTRSNTFIARCLFIADLYFHFQVAAEKQKVNCSFYTATDLSSVAYTPLPAPDAYLVVTKAKKKSMYFLDFYEERLPMKEIRRRVRRYTHYFEANYWQEHNKEPFPVIFLVCSLPRVQKSLSKLIADEAGSDMSFFLAQKSNIQEKGIQSDTWEAV